MWNGLAGARDRIKSGDLIRFDGIVAPSADVRNAVWQLAIVKKKKWRRALSSPGLWTIPRRWKEHPAGQRSEIVRFFRTKPVILVASFAIIFFSLPSPYKWTSRLNGRTGIVRTHRGRTKAAFRIFIFVQCPVRCYQVAAATAGSVRRCRIEMSLSGNEGERVEPKLCIASWNSISLRYFFFFYVTVLYLICIVPSN